MDNTFVNIAANCHGRHNNLSIIMSTMTKTWFREKACIT